MLPPPPSSHLLALSYSVLTIKSVRFETLLYFRNCMVCYLSDLYPLRYYVAEGVRIYSQETWRLVTESRGVKLVEQHISNVVSGHAQGLQPLHPQRTYFAKAHHMKGWYRMLQICHSKFKL